jgi:hypothetical protein
MMLHGKIAPSFQEKKKKKVGDSVYFPDEGDSSDAPLLVVESRDKTLSTISGARKLLLKKCRNGLDDIRSSLHTSSAWELQTLDDSSFSGSLYEASESSLHSVKVDSSSTENSSDFPTKLMKTCENGSDEMMSTLLDASNISLGSNGGSVASFLEDSGESFAFFAGTDEDIAHTSAYGDNGGEVAERSFSNFGCELEDSDLSDSESDLLEEGGGPSIGILQLTFNVGGSCSLSNLESRPDDSNTTETSPKVPRSRSLNEKIPGSQHSSSRKDSNIYQARIDDFPVNASPNRRLLRSKSNDIVLPTSRSSLLSDNSEKDGRKELRRSSSADKFIGGHKTPRRRDSSDKANIKSGREGLKTSRIDRRPRSPSADKEIEPDRRSIHSDGKLSRRRSSSVDKLVGRTTIEKEIDDESDDFETTGGRRRTSCQNSFSRRPPAARRRAEVARVLQPLSSSFNEKMFDRSLRRIPARASSFNEKMADRSLRRIPARAASSRCLMSSRSEHSPGLRLSAREEPSSNFHDKRAERPVRRRLPARAASTRGLMSSTRSEDLREVPDFLVGNKTRSAMTTRK